MNATACKLVAVVLACGACGGGLLAARQARIQSAHELAEARLRMRQHRLELERIRNEIARLSVPSAVARQIERTGMEEVLRPAAESVYEPERASIDQFPLSTGGQTGAGFAR